MSLIQLKAYLVGALPACNAGAAGELAYVTDANAPTYNGAVSTTGSATDSVVCVTTNSGSTYGWVYR